VSVRRYLTISVILSAAVLPVIIGASCPPPSTPYFATIGSNTIGVATDVPECSPGFVCISVVNTTFIDIDVSLYVHDGFDLELDYCMEDRQTNEDGGTIIIDTYENLSEECPGYNLGEFQLARTQLFDPPEGLDSNLYLVQGRNIRTLEHRETLLVRIQEGDIKTFGIEVAQSGLLPDNPEIQDGPYYRCTLLNLGWYYVPRAAEHIPTGETFQFVVFDESGGVVPGLAQLATTSATSSVGGCPSVQ